MAARNWNPREPYVLGLEWPGMRRVPVPLSQDVEYGHTFQAGATETIDTATFAITAPTPNGSARATALITVYRRDSNDVDETGNELEYGTVVSQMVQANGGTLGGAAALNGGATIAECVITPSDNKSVTIPTTAGSQLDVEFATAGLFTGKRILEVKVHYAGVFTSRVDGTDATTTVGVGTAAADDVAIVAPLEDGVADPFVTLPVHVLTFGEVNYGSGVLPLCWPWTVADVQAFDATRTVRFRLSSGGGYVITYAALEVVWCEENREAVAALLLGADTAAGEEPMAAGRHSANLRTPAGVDNWAKVADDFYTVTVTSARSPSTSLAFAGTDTQGDPPLVPLLDAFNIFENHQGRVSPRLPSNVLGALGADSRVGPIKFVTTGGVNTSDNAPYDNVVGAQVYNGGPTQTQEIEERSGAAAVDYPWLRFYARIIGDPADVPAIDITTVDGTTNYFATTLLALPEIFDGWREVTLLWPGGQEPSIDNTGADYAVTFSTTQGNVANRWEILGVDSEALLVVAPANGNPTYGGDNTAWIEGATTHNYADLVVTLHTLVEDIDGFAVEALPLIVPGQTAGAPTPCQVSTVDYVYIEWTATLLAAADFAYYEIERQDTIDTTFRVIARITDPTQEFFFDLEARFGVVSTYRMRQRRADGIWSTYTASPTATPTIGDTHIADGCGFLYFASNEYTPASAIVFSESYATDPTGVFDFVEAGDYTLTRHYGRFGTQSFHPTERGGVSFERVLLVNGITATTNRADHEFDRLRDMAYRDVPYVCVKDDLGNRWFATVIVPQASVRRPGNIELATVRIIESTETPWPADDQAAL